MSQTCVSLVSASENLLKRPIVKSLNGAMLIGKAYFFGN